MRNVGLDLAKNFRIKAELGNRIGSIIIWFDNRSLDANLNVFLQEN